MEKFGTNRAIVSRLNLFARGSALLSVLVGCVVLIGWLLQIPSLKTVVPGLVSMKANTALCLVFCGISLWFAVRNSPENPARKFAMSFGRCLAIAVILVALATLAEHFLHWDLRIDQLLFADLQSDGHSLPGRMAPPTAFCFFFLGVALAVPHIETKRGVLPAQFLSFVPVSISLVAVMGYLFSFISFHRVISFTGIALHTAVTLFMLSVATFFASPDRGLAGTILSEDLGGIIFRRLIAPAFLAPTVIACLRMEGQKLGLYGTEFGISLLVTANIAVFSFVIYRSGMEISRIAAARRESESALQTSRDGLLQLNYTFGAVIDACPLPIVTFDNEKRVQVWNRAAERLLGWSFIQVRGRQIALAPEDRREEFQTILEILALGNEVTGAETVLLSRDDTNVAVTVWAAPITFESPGPSGCVLILEDAALRKKPQDALRHG